MDLQVNDDVIGLVDEGEVDLGQIGVEELAIELVLDALLLLPQYIN